MDLLYLRPVSLALVTFQGRWVSRRVGRQVDYWLLLLFGNMDFAID